MFGEGPVTMIVRAAVCFWEKWRLVRRLRRLSVARSSGLRAASRCRPSSPFWMACPCASWALLWGMVTRTGSPSLDSMRRWSSMHGFRAFRRIARPMPTSSPRKEKSPMSSVFRGATGRGSAWAGSTTVTPPTSPALAMRSCWMLFRSAVYSSVLTATSRERRTTSCWAPGSVRTFESMRPLSARSWAICLSRVATTSASSR